MTKARRKSSKLLRLVLVVACGLILWRLNNAVRLDVKPMEEESGYFMVTGAAGYIGSHMALSLLERGESVLGVDNLSRGSQQAIDTLAAFPSFSFEKVDLKDKAYVETLFSKYNVEHVLHFASPAFAIESFVEPDLYRRNILENTKILVDTMVKHGVSSLFFSSSCAVYGVQTSLPITEDAETKPVSPYGKEKLAAEQYIRSKVSSGALKATIFRYFNVVGSDKLGRLRENARPQFSKYARLWTACLDVVLERRNCVPLHGGNHDTPDGTTIRDYVHVSDVVGAHLAVLDATNNISPLEIMNVGNEKPVSTMEFIETARRITGSFIPVCLSNNNSLGGPPALFASSSRLKKSTDWRPSINDIETMIKTAWKTVPQAPSDWRAKPYDVCIVGAGLSGAVLAEQHASVLGHSVLVMEKRNHIGGNCYDYIDEETGIRVSKYGVHLFHTKSKPVWDYLQRFSDWTHWEHRCLARVGNQHVPVPINIDSVNALFNLSISSEPEMETWLKEVQIDPPTGTAVDSEQVALQRVGPVLYDLIFKPYTIKQWNRSPKELNPSVLSRIPVRTSRDNRYFTDLYQALPTNGYTRIFENMFSSNKITVRLNTDFFQEREKIHCGHTYFTGPIDAYFSSQGLPKLEYRSLSFERRVFHNTEFFQPEAHVNYPSMDYNFTRAIEYKHLLHQKASHTVVMFERSTDDGEPYYPVPNERNHALYKKYQRMAVKEPDVTFAGRLANYKYFNMDESVLNALNLFNITTAAMTKVLDRR